jgi:hypothetical protein
VMLDGRAVFGQYESTGVKPADLDACGGHVGNTPASTITSPSGAPSTYGATSLTYHYHVQDEAPFFVGCFGKPALTVATAKALYPACADSAATATCSCSASSTSCSCADGSSWAACTSLGSYASYRINCPVYAGLSQRNSADAACLPCTGGCKGAAAGGTIAAASGSNAAAVLALGAAAVAAVAAASLA